MRNIKWILPGVLFCLCLYPKNHSDSLLQPFYLNPSLSFYTLKKPYDDKPFIRKIKLRKNLSKAKRIIAAVLAFPFPFGIIGLHRIYMGTSPYVPVIYIASLGGIFGVLPFIDFCILVLDKKFERYFNNPRLFMWIQPSETSQPYSPVKD